MANEFAVDESAGVVEVCVRAYGYYFSVNITITSLTTSGMDVHTNDNHGVEELFKSHIFVHIRKESVIP